MSKKSTLFRENYPLGIGPFVFCIKRERVDASFGRKD